jgi:2-succinyl-5-enolpyruvyl-6-hydroxy-3-cyclohexene-1-carboxylate synthase
MIYPKIPLAQSILEICRQKGIQHIVISPGSRNAPLTIGFASNANFTCYSVADERCAAFFALGIAQQIQAPVAVICTSGSAVLNYYPAVAEAFYNQIPLLVISADRPQSKIDIGDGQTIRQEHVFANHSLFNANLTEKASDENDHLICQAIDVAIHQKGPVHINAPFEEPLYQTTDQLLVQPDFQNTIPSTNPPIYDWKEVATEWNNAAKKLVLIGGLMPHSIDQKWLDRLMKDPSVVVMTEVTSNVHHPQFITNIDTFITPFTEADFDAFQPDVLLTIGGMIVSKRIKSFLRSHQPKIHWHADDLRAYNTFGCLSQHFILSPNVFFETLLPLSNLQNSNYQELAIQVIRTRTQKHEQYLERISFSDFKAFEIILDQLPHHIQLQISNSSPIRYAQLFPIHPSIEVFCNRGTSGIDGSTSTAIGAASVAHKPTLLITGDIGFLYDSNALWNHYIPNNFKIILINNGGGGIFRILPGHQETAVFNQFFETSHCLTAEHLAKMYGFDYQTASSEATLQQSLDSFFTYDQKPAILEVFTPTRQNDSILLNYFKNLV